MVGGTIPGAAPPRATSGAGPRHQSAVGQAGPGNVVPWPTSAQRGDLPGGVVRKRLGLRKPVDTVELHSVAEYPRATEKVRAGRSFRALGYFLRPASFQPASP